ncbi:hypothetical protein PMAYCL1PPCAC_14490, partial [Pristionchus mayeri]
MGKGGGATWSQNHRMGPDPRPALRIAASSLALLALLLLRRRLATRETLRGSSGHGQIDDGLIVLSLQLAHNQSKRSELERDLGLGWSAGVAGSAGAGAAAPARSAGSQRSLRHSRHSRRARRSNCSLDPAAKGHTQIRTACTAALLRLAAAGERSLSRRSVVVVVRDGLYGKLRCDLIDWGIVVLWRGGLRRRLNENGIAVHLRVAGDGLCGLGNRDIVVLLRDDLYRRPRCDLRGRGVVVLLRCGLYHLFRRRLSHIGILVEVAGIHNLDIEGSNGRNWSLSLLRIVASKARALGSRGHVTGTRGTEVLPIVEVRLVLISGVSGDEILVVVVVLGGAVREGSARHRRSSRRVGVVAAHAGRGGDAGAAERGAGATATPGGGAQARSANVLVVADLARRADLHLDLQSGRDAATTGGGPAAGVGRDSVIFEDGEGRPPSPVSHRS